MSDTTDQIGSAVISTALSTAAGFIGGPVLAAAVGIICGVPVQLLAAAALATVIWLDPVTGIWLAVAALAALAGFILGAVRRPPRLSLITRRDDSGHRITQLETQLTHARVREQALLAALASRPPAYPPAPVIRGSVTR